MSRLRTKRVSDLIVREAAAILLSDVKDPRIGIITLTGADVSPDLRNAKVYYTVIGDDKVRENTAVGLARAAGYIRKELGSRLELKSTPSITFAYDESIDRGFRITELLGSVKK